MAIKLSRRNAGRSKIIPGRGRNPHATRGLQVARFAPLQRAASDPSQRMREAIDSVKGRRLYSQRMATVEPVFANIRYHKRMSRFTLRGEAKVSTQWWFYCLVHNAEKLAKKQVMGDAPGANNPGHASVRQH